MPAISKKQTAGPMSVAEIKLSPSATVNVTAEAISILKKALME